MKRALSLLKLLFSTGQQRRLTGRLGRLVTAWAAAIAIWVVYYTTLGTGDLFAMTISFLAAMMALLFITISATPKSNPAYPSVLDFSLALASIAAGIYFTLNSEIIIGRISLLDPLSGYDLLFGTILFVLTIEATRRTVGMSLTLVVLVFIAYNLFGHHLGGAVGHGYISYQHFLDLMVFTTDGIFGVPLRVAATYVFLFVLFGTFLTRAGGGEFFFNLAAALTGRKIGGPAKVAIISSGLYGTISGSPTSDVVVTGSITIPMMRRLGYPAALAAGIEVTASTGGGILPPVMGSAAFIMAEYTGISYRDIALAATLPSLLYFVGIYAQVHLRSLRLGLMGMDAKDIPKLGPTLRQGTPFFVPLTVLMIALLLGYSPSFIAIFATLSVIAVSLFSKKFHLGFKDVYEILAETTLLVLSATAACAAAGLVIGGLTMTGLAGKFSSLVFLLTESNLFLSLLVGAAMTILLGMGMPTPSVYIFAAVLIGPMLISLGMPVMAAHMFLLYYACMSAITPPVAVAAFAAAAIAQINPLQIALAAVRLSIVTFIVPFAFVYSQGLLLIGSPLVIILEMISATAGALLLAVAAEGYFKSPVAWWGRLLLTGAGLCLFVPMQGWTILAASGLALAAFALSPGLRFSEKNPARAKTAGG
jgi:TRAP transporter 4TM/12TM fusion protein